MQTIPSRAVHEDIREERARSRDEKKRMFTKYTSKGKLNASTALSPALAFARN
jgi:hypothetical protein